MQRLRQFLLVPALLLTYTSARSDNFSFPNFADSSALSINADSSTITSADGVVLRLAPALAQQVGSGFTIAQHFVGAFSTHFTFRLTLPGGVTSACNGVNGGDGFAFVVQSESPIALGGSGGYLGLQGIAKSIAVEFDTWCNPQFQDPSSNHIGVLVGGVVSHGPGAPYAVHVSPRFDNGELWHAWIDYDGLTIRVYASLSPARPFQPLVTREVDYGVWLDGDSAFVGFTAGTYAVWENHDILSWQFGDYVPFVVGDFDGDGLVGSPDLAVLLGSWGSSLGVFDLNGDTQIDSLDLALLLGNWSTS